MVKPPMGFPHRWVAAIITLRKNAWHTPDILTDNCANDNVSTNQLSHNICLSCISIISKLQHITYETRNMLRITQKFFVSSCFSLHLKLKGIVFKWWIQNFIKYSIIIYLIFNIKLLTLSCSCNCLLN